eukprot:4892315-Prymnesium_polylepis.1
MPHPPGQQLEGPVLQIQVQAMCHGARTRPGPLVSTTTRRLRPNILPDFRAVSTVRHAPPGPAVLCRRATRTGGMAHLAQPVETLAAGDVR